MDRQGCKKSVSTRALLGANIHQPERFFKIGMSFLNICSNLQANTVKSISYFFKRTISSQVTIEIGKYPPKMERILAYSRSDFSIWNFVLGEKIKLFAALVSPCDLTKHIIVQRCSAIAWEDRLNLKKIANSMTMYFCPIYTKYIFCHKLALMAIWYLNIKLESRLYF